METRVTAWEITPTEEPGGLQFVESQKSQTRLSNWTAITTSEPTSEGHLCGSMQEWDPLSCREQELNHIEVEYSQKAFNFYPRDVENFSDTQVK